MSRAATLQAGERAATAAATLPEMEAYLGVAQADREAAARAWRMLEPMLDEILDRFYCDTTRYALMPALSPAQIARLKARQRRHWRQVFEVGLDARFESEARRMGLAHVQLGVPASAFVLANMKLLSLLLDALPAAGTDCVRDRSPILKMAALDMGYTLSAYDAELVE